MDISARKGSGKLQQVITIGKHELLSDAPEALGGEDAGPSRTICWPRRWPPARR